jgi:hypothetical protein
VRYWLDGEDEDYERELERVNRFGGAQPSPLRASHAAGVAFLVGIQAVALMSVIFAFVLESR